MADGFYFQLGENHYFVFPGKGMFNYTWKGEFCLESDFSEDFSSKLLWTAISSGIEKEVKDGGLVPIRVKSFDLEMAIKVFKKGNINRIKSMLDFLLDNVIR